MEHPNLGEEAEVPEEVTPVNLGPDGKPIKKVNCFKLMKNMDSTVIKPFLIYNYESASHKKQREFFEIMMSKGVHLEEAYAGSQVPSDEQKRLLSLISKNTAEANPHGGIEMSQQRKNDSHENYYVGSDGNRYPLLSEEHRGGNYA